MAAFALKGNTDTDHVSVLLVKGRERKGTQEKDEETEEGIGM